MRKMKSTTKLSRLGHDGHHPRRRSLIRWPATLIVLGVLFGLALSGNVQAQVEFDAVIVNLNNVKHPTAQIDVSINTDAGTGLPVTFRVFNADDGTRLSEFVLYTNANGFCSSSSAAAPNDNLFTASGGRT